MKRLKSGLAAAVALFLIAGASHSGDVWAADVQVAVAANFTDADFSADKIGKKK